MVLDEQQTSGPETKDIPGLPAAEKAALSADPKPSDAATKEAKQLSSGRTLEELKDDAERREHVRNQGFKDLFEKLVKAGMFCAFIAILVTACVWVWHLITPASWQWLTDKQIEHIQGMATGGVIAVIVGDHFKRRLG